MQLMITKRNIFIILFIAITILFCACSTLGRAQKMKRYLNKELVAKVGEMCEETVEYDPCAGQQIYLVLLFDKKNVQVYEKYISSCDKESILIIGTYNWKLLRNKKIRIDFIPEQTKGNYAENLFVEFRTKQLVGSITDFNGKTIEHFFKEITK